MRRSKKPLAWGLRTLLFHCDILANFQTVRRLELQR